MLTQKLISRVLPIVALGGLGFVGSAQAVTLDGSQGGRFTLTGEFSLTAINPDPFSLIIDDMINVSATGGSIVDFDPQGDGGVASFGGLGSTEGEFIPWASDTSTIPPTLNGAEILDIGILPDGNLVLPSDPTVLPTIEDWITADSSATAPGVPVNDIGWTFDLEEVDADPTFTQSGNDVLISVGFAGHYDDEDGLPVLTGSGNFTSQFEDETVVNLLADLVGLDPGPDGIFGTDDDEAVDPVTRSSTWSADFVAQAQDVPESDTKLGLAIALGLGLLSIKKSKRFIG